MKSHLVCGSLGALLLAAVSGGCIVGMGSDHPPQSKAEPQLPFLNEQAGTASARSLKPLPIPRENWRSSGSTSWGGVRIDGQPNMIWLRPLDYAPESRIQTNFQPVVKARRSYRASDLPKDQMGQVLALNTSSSTLQLASELDWDSGELMYEFAWGDARDRDALRKRSGYFFLDGDTLRVEIVRPVAGNPSKPNKKEFLNTVGRWCRKAILSPGAEYLAVISADGPRQHTSIMAVYGLDNWIEFPGRRYVEFFDTTTWQTVGEPVSLIDSEACQFQSACWLSPEFFVAICEGRLWLVPFPKLAPPPPDAPAAKPDTPAAPAAPPPPTPPPHRVPDPAPGSP